MVRSGSYLVAWIIELLVGGIASEATRGRSRGDRNTFFTPTWGNPPSSRYLRPDASGPKEDSSIRRKSIEVNPFRMGEIRSRAKLAGFCRWGWSGFLPLKVAGFHAAVNTYCTSFPGEGLSFTLKEGQADSLFCQVPSAAITAKWFRERPAIAAEILKPDNSYQ